MKNKFYYGWTPSKPDHRDLMFTRKRLNLAPSVDLVPAEKKLPFDPTTDQGELGSCGPNSAAANIGFDLLTQNVINPPQPSRLFIYYVTRGLMKTVNSDSGVDNRTMLQALAKFGWCDESLWPYNISQYRIQPNAAAISQAAGRCIDKYMNVPQNIDSMRTCIANGNPILYGFTVYESFESDATTATGIVTIPTRMEQVLGGHDVLLVGYDDATQMFKFQNHYGPDWGAGGYGFMPYAYALNPKLASDFWTVQHSPFNGPIVTPPVTPPAPVSSQPTGIEFPVGYVIPLPTGTKLHYAG